MDIAYAQLISFIFMCSLLAWSIGWISVSAIKLKKKNKHRTLWWKTHSYWCLVNALIAGVSLMTLFGREQFDADYVMMQRNIVLVNIFLDVFYLLIAYFLTRKPQDKYIHIGHAVAIQAVFLIVLDTIIVTSLIVLL